MSARVLTRNGKASLIVRLESLQTNEAPVWMNFQLYGETVGALKMTLRGGDYGEELHSHCVDDEILPSATSYALLLPGQGRETEFPLDCYDVPVDSVSVELLYRDRYASPPPVPVPGAVLVRGPLMWGPRLLEFP